MAERKRQRVVVRGVDWYCNVYATHLVREAEDGIIYVYDGEELVGVFDIGGFMCMYMSEQNIKEQNKTEPNRTEPNRAEQSGKDGANER